MVQKVRKEMAKAKANKHGQKVDMTKLIKKKPTGGKTKREGKQYQFQGFYERLKSLDVKQSHSMEAFMQYDTLVDPTEMENQLQSNFIAFLKTEKMNNRTLDFKRVFTDVEPLAYSHALVVLNKRQLITRLLKHLRPSSGGAQLGMALATSESVIKCKVLELIVALVKDLRQDIYREFVELIMPAAIAAVDVQDVALLDSVFTLFSFSFKFLLKPIRDDIENFFEVFQELIIHKNRHLRRFAAQSFSYIIRKMEMNSKLVEMILKPLYSVSAGPFVTLNVQQGVSDVFFEVLYGASQDLHSKSDELLAQLFQRQPLDDPFVRTVRFLLIKLFNAIDTSKQHPLFAAVYGHLLNNGAELSEKPLSLALSIIQDAVKFKYGSRLSHLSTIQVLESLNHIMKKQNHPALESFSSETKEQLALTLGEVYYFKHTAVSQIFASSSIDLASSKTIFTHHIYQICQSHIDSYFSILASRSNAMAGDRQIKAVPAGLGDQMDYETLLGLRAGQKTTVFTQDSHIQKLKQLLPSLHKFISKNISSFELQTQAVQMVSLFNQLASMYLSHHHSTPDASLVFPMSPAAEKVLQALLDAASGSISGGEEQQLVVYNIVKYANICKYEQGAQPLLHSAISALQPPAFVKLTLDLSQRIQGNFVLRNYSLPAQTLEKEILEVMDFENQGFDEDIGYHTGLQLDVTIDRVIENPSNIHLLRRYVQKTAGSTFSFREHGSLVQALRTNLMKNSTQLRQQTLVILKRFETLKYVDVADRELSEHYKGQLCGCIQLMEDFEKTEVGFASEKNKIMQLQRLEVMFNSGAVPAEYLEISYDFLIGCLWIKFAPLFASVHSAVGAIVRNTTGQTRQQLVEKHAKLVRTLSLLSQLEGHDNESLHALVNQNLNKTPSSATSIAAGTYRSDCTIEGEFLEIKDMFYQVLQCFSGVLGPCILQQKSLKEPFFDLFYEFLNKEYLMLHQKSEGVAARVDTEQDRPSYLLDRMTYANMLDSEGNRGHLRAARTKMSNFLDVFRKADSLGQAPKIADFQKLLLNLLNTNDSKQQKCALECLIKSGYRRGLMAKYKKLLEGFSDDEKFKDMIPILIHGSQTRSGDADVPEEYQKDSEDKVVQKSKRKETKSVIPKLEEEDRSAMLPVIIKLLQSKLLQKKGAINKKNLHTRRNIVYEFFASLSPSTEFPLFFNELLEPVNLSMQSYDVEEIQNRLSCVSFNSYLTFINSLEVVFKQVGTLLMANLPTLAKVVVEGVIKLTKMFTKQFRDAKADEADGGQGESESEDDEAGNGDERVHRNAAKQAKTCLRKSLGLVKDIYRKFSQHADFIKEFSNTVYQEVVGDQLEALKVNYVSAKSQLLEVLCLSWPEHLNTLSNFERYPQVVPAIMDMLPHKAIDPDVVALHMSLLKKLILGTLDFDDQELKSQSVSQKRRMLDEPQVEGEEEGDANQSSDLDEDQAMEDQQVVAECRRQRRETSTRILRNNVEAISRNIHSFWKNHANELRRVLASRGSQKKAHPGQSAQGAKRDASTKLALGQQARESAKKFHTAKDLLFILSEMSAYLHQDSEVNHDFLEMIVDVLSIRNLHRPNSNNAELLTFGAQSITNLIPKIKQGELQSGLVDKIMRLFLVINAVKVRSQLSAGLLTALASQSSSEMVSVEVLTLIRDLNKIKRGIADMETDCDSSIQAIQGFLQGDRQSSMTALEVRAVTCSVAYLCKHEEYSMREYAEHALNHIFGGLQAQKEDQGAQSLVSLLESQFVEVYLVTVRDEMVLKTVLRCLRSLIVFVKEQNLETKYQLDALAPLCSPKDENEDFFECFLAIKLKQRQRCLKRLKQRIEEGGFAQSLKTLEHVIMPMVDYLVFGGATHKEHQRNTISYDKDQKLATLEEGLNIYTAYASQLRWTGYYKLLKKLLVRLQRANTRVNAVSSHGQPELAKEKIITKAICRILAGFHFTEVQDAIEVLNQKSHEDLEQKEDAHASLSLWSTDFADLLQKQISMQDGEDPQADEEELEQGDDEDQDKDAEEDDQHDELALEEDQDQEMQDEGAEVPPEVQVLDIQSKLLNKVLPVLERHLTENGDQHSVRGFVVVCMAKTIRKLPLPKFNARLQKLVNSIVVQGLRSRDLSHREKARKALVKLVDEISPRFLSIIFEEMKSQLTKGFQQHVYLFTVHALLQGLAENKALTSSCITTRMINLNTDILLSELFGELNAEKDNTQNNDLKLIKESKARKAIPIFEIFAEYTDFKSSFMNVLAPIINILDQSPSYSKIQQCEDLLSRVSSALMKNETVGGPTLLLFLYSIIERGVKMAAKVKINDDKEERDYGATVSPAIHKKTREEYKEINMKVEMYWTKGNQTIDNKKTQEISGRVLASFGLQCFKKALKNKEIIVNEDAGLLQEREQKLKEMVTRLDPFVPLILNSFKTYHNPIVVCALHIMTQIVGLGLPSFKELLKKFLNRIFKLFEQTQSSDSDFINSLFKCTSELIKTYAIYQDLSEIQVKTLVQIIRTHIPKFAVQSNALQCLRSVIHRRFMCADLYDLIEQVQEMMVFNTSSSIRGICASIFIQFLLDYPLENDRIESHLNFILKNLACKRLEGRLQLLDILKTLIERFPKDVVDLYCELLFFTLLLRAVNDEQTEARVKVQQVMRTLVFSEKVSQSKVKTLLNTILQMGSADESKRELLQLAKLNALQLLAESGMNKSTKLKLQETRQILNSACQDVINGEAESLQRRVSQVSKTFRKNEEDHEDEPDASMKNFLQAIQLLDDDEDGQGPKQEDLEAAEDDPERHSSNKQWTLLYHAFSCVEKLIENQDKKATIAMCTDLGLPQQLLLFAQYHQSYWIRLVCQRLLGHIFASQRESNGDLVIMLGLDVPEQLVNFTYDFINCLNKPIYQEDMKNQIIKNLIFLVQTLLSKQQDGMPTEITKLYRKISYIGRKAMLDIRTSKDCLETILQFFNASFSLEVGESGADFMKLVCSPVLELVYRTYTDEQYAKGSIIKDVSLEIVELLQRDLDKPFFIDTYDKVKASILQKRLDRKVKQKQLVATKEGLAMRQNKRVRKQNKKKEKKQQKMFFDKLKH